MKMSAEEATPSAGLSLLQLLNEVRNMIYSYVFERTEARVSWTCQNPRIGTVSGTIRWEDPRLRHILATCRTVRAEAFPILYKQVRFRISMIQRDPRFDIADFVEHIGSDAVRSITKLSLDRGSHIPRKLSFRGLKVNDLIYGDRMLDLIAGCVRHFPTLEELRLINGAIKENQLVKRTPIKKSLSRQATLAQGNTRGGTGGLMFSSLT